MGNNSKINPRYNLHVRDVIVIAISILLVVALLMYTIFGMTHTVDDMSYVQISYGQQVIYYRPITEEHDPLVITREMGITGDSKNNIKPNENGQEFEFVGDTVEVRIVDHSIQVVQETSPRKICSHQGVISYSNVPIICDPNHLSIVIVGGYIDPDLPDA